MFYNKRTNGIVLRPNQLFWIVGFISIIILPSLALPQNVSAGIADLSAKVFNFVRYTVEGGKRIGEIREGIITPDVEKQLKDTGQWDDMQSLLEAFPDEKGQKMVKGLYVSNNELSNPDSLFLGKFVKSAVDLDVAAYDTVGTAGVFNNLPISLENVAKLPLKVRVAMGIKDMFGAVKTLFGIDNKATKETEIKPSDLSGQMSKPLSGDENKDNSVSVQSNNPLDKQKLPATQPSTQNNKASVPTTEQTQPPTQQPPVNNEQKTSSSILVVDQFNEPVEGARVWLEDEQGKTYPSGNWVGYWNTDKVGRLFFSYDDNGQIPNGKFNIHVEKENYSPTKESMDISSSPVAVVISPTKFVLNKLPIITGILLDTSGEPAISKSYKNVSDSPFGYTPKITITSNDGKEISCCAYANPKTGRFESKPLPPGHYLLKIWIPGGYQKSDIVMATKELDISYNQKEVWLGQITINGIPF